MVELSGYNIAKQARGIAIYTETVKSERERGENWLRECTFPSDLIIDTAGRQSQAEREKGGGGEEEMTLVHVHAAAAS